MITRRKFLRSSAATGLTLAASGLAAPAIAQGAKIKLGYVSPQTGLAGRFRRKRCLQHRSLSGLRGLQEL